MAFDVLMTGLERARGLGFVCRREGMAAGLQLFIYTPRCVYEDGWDEFTVMARGLIVAEATSQHPCGRRVTLCLCSRPQPSQRPPAWPNRMAWLSSGQSIG